MIIRIVISIVFTWILTTTLLFAQIPPCGRRFLVADKNTGSPIETRFIPAPPDHVEASTLKALPAVGAVLEKKDGLTLKAKSDGKPMGSIKGNFGLWGAWYSVNLQGKVKGWLMSGTTIGEWSIEFQPETRDGVSGTNLKISFERAGSGSSKNGALPLMDEIDCLCGLLSRVDPRTNPTGPASTVGSTDERTLTLAEGTPLQVIIRDPWYSKNAEKTAGKEQLFFEVATDVVVEGAPLVRKGALAVGKFTQLKAASGGGKGAIVEFVIDYVTAVDGQSISVRGATGSGRGGTFSPNTATPGLGGAAGGALSALGDALQKGYETLIRAGTAFDVAVSGTHSIKVAK